MTPFEIAAIWGAVAGSASVVFLIYKFVTDKPKLTFEEEIKVFYPAHDNNFFTTISIQMKVHNRGSKPTTIYHSKLDFNYNSKHREMVDDRSTFEVVPDSTSDFYPNLNLHKDDLILQNKITKCVLTITHTYGKAIINLGTIEENKN